MSEYAREHPEEAARIASLPPSEQHWPVVGGPIRTEWTPEYAPWRHGGYYVTNVQYPDGAVGCVSRNYPDGKWRIVCDNRGPNGGRTLAFTYPSRDAAARAERELTMVRP